MHTLDCKHYFQFPKAMYKQIIILYHSEIEISTSNYLIEEKEKEEWEVDVNFFSMHRTHRMLGFE